MHEDRKQAFLAHTVISSDAPVPTTDDAQASRTDPDTASPRDVTHSSGAGGDETNEENAASSDAALMTHDEAEAGTPYLTKSRVVLVSRMYM